MPSSPAVLYLWLGAGVVSVSFASIFIRLADADPLAVSAYRMTIAAVIVAVPSLLFSRGELIAVRSRDFPALAASGFFLAAHTALWIASLSHTSVASSTLLVTTTPVFVAATAHLVARDHVRRITALAVAVSVAGGVILAAGDWTNGNRRLFGDGLALAGAVAVAGYILVGRRVRARIANLPYVTVVYTISAALLVAFAVASGTPLWRLAPETYFWAAAAALVPQAIGRSLINWSLAYWPVTNVALAVRAEPIIATAIAVPVLGEVPSWTIIPGGRASFAWRLPRYSQRARRMRHPSGAEAHCRSAILGEAGPPT